MKTPRPVLQSPEITCAQLIKQFPQLFLEVIGDADRKIRGVSSPESAAADKILFLATAKAFAEGFASAAKVLVIPKKSRAQAETLRGDRTLLVAASVELGMSVVINAFFLKTPYTNQGIQNRHASASIATTAVLADDVRVGPNVFIGDHVTIAAGCYIGANAVVEDGVSIGANTVIHPLAFIGHSTEIGANCEVNPNSVIGKEGFGYAHDEKFNHYRIPHIGRVVLEDNVHIGSCVTIDRATLDETRLAAGVRLDNQIQVAHNCKVGRNSLLTSGFMVAGSTTIGANFVAGGRSVATGHVTVCDNVQIAALSGISKDITTPGQYGGVPLVPIQQHVKIKAAMAQLPEMRKQLNRIVRKLGLMEEKAPETEV